MDFMNSVVAAGLLVTALGVGIVIGGFMERRYVLTRALDAKRPYGSAVHMDGKFYYVIEEGWFCSEYVLRPKTDHRHPPVADTHDDNE